MILITGATGYIGGRLLKALEQRGKRVRCLSRRPDELAPRVGPFTEVVPGDVLYESSLRNAMDGVTTAYYLVHAMGAGGDFESRDRQAAQLFGQAARASGVQRIIYLGGLAHGEDLSPHLRSRLEVGRVLRESGVPTIEFRASIIIGSGSLSFEMIRSLVRRLPVMVTPRWVHTMAQPIATEDVIDYLLAALDVRLNGSEIFEIGGADRASYLDIMREFARQRGVRRWMIPVPVLTPRLSGLWLTLVTPLYARVGRRLIDSIRNETIVHDHRAPQALGVRPRGLRVAIERALVNEDRQFAETRWSDAFSTGGQPRSWGGVRLGSRIVDSRSLTVTLPPERAFRPVAAIGGRNGWYCADLLWQIRGLIDLLLGGVGLRRGRRDPDNLRVGDTLDFWRVEAFERPRLLRLRAEMKLPGRAWLQFEVTPVPGGSEIRQTAMFDPYGLAGLLYWYALYPLHAVIFRGMLRGIARRARAAVSPSSAKARPRSYPLPP